MKMKNSFDLFEGVFFITAAIATQVGIYKL